VLAPLTNDALRDLPRIALLAVRPEDFRQLPLAGLVHELAGGNVRGRVHAHVQRRVGRIREPALGPVELHARDAEVEEDRVGAAAVVGEPLQHVGEVPGQEPCLDAGAAPERLEVRLDVGIPVDGDVLAVAVQVLGEHGGMAACPEGRVDDGVPGLHVEQAPNLLGEDGDMISRAWLQDARQHAPHSLRPR